MTTEEQPKCPVDHSTREAWVKNMGTGEQAPKQLPADHPVIPSGNGEAACPVNHEARGIWLKHANATKQVEDIECSSEELPSTPHYTTDVPLPTERETSSIPRTGTDSKWIYPSQKQFFEAMKRKNWDPSTEDMKTVVPIHNSVNERVWNYIKLWEANEGGKECGGIQLSSFKGDAKKLTPRAWFRSAILGYSKPFDRHDWTIDRCGKQLQYVIDFYSNDSPVTGPDIYIDVRPKLNSFEGVKLRFKKMLGL